jgi:hypothetical protein
VSDQGTSYPQDEPRPEPPRPEAPPASPAYGQPAYGPSSQPPSQPPYQPSYQPQQAYGPPYSQGAPDQVRFHQPGPTVEHPQATLAFVLGLLSVLGLTILGPLGWYYGNKVVAQIDQDPREYNNRGIAMAGKVLGIIGTVFLALTVLLAIGAIIFAVAASSSR